MFRLLKKILLIISLIAFIVTLGYMLRNFVRRDLTDALVDEITLSELEIIEYPDKQQSLLLSLPDQIYGSQLILPNEWEGYKVLVEGQTVESPLHSLMKELDNEYSIIRIRHPKWTEDTPYQDIVFTVFKIEEWNENASNATDGEIILLPSIVQFNEEHLLTIDPSNYDITLDGYEEVLMILVDTDVTSRLQDGYKTLGGISIETEHVMYETGIRDVRIKWRNIYKDEIISSDTYVLEKQDDLGWKNVVLEFGHSIQAVASDYEISTGESSWYSYNFESLNDGEYRIGIDYLRKSLYGIDLIPGTYPVYRVYEEFKVGDENILRSTSTDGEDDSLEGVWIETENEVYDLGTQEVRIKWYNTLEDEMLYGNHYTLERQDQEGWVQVTKELDEDIAFTDMGYMLLANEERWQNFYLMVWTDGLTKGKYRINTSFSRHTYNGEDFGPGNYPRYQVYAYFEVGDEKQKKTLTNLHGSKIEYLNEEYGFALYMPEDWKGFSIAEELPIIESPLHDLISKLDSDYFILRLRHPKWSEEVKRQDIVFTILRRELWNENANSATNENVSLLPDTVFSNWTYIFAIDPYNYDVNLQGYNEAFDILSNHIKNY